MRIHLGVAWLVLLAAAPILAQEASDPPSPQQPESLGPPASALDVLEFVPLPKLLDLEPAVADQLEQVLTILWDLIARGEGVLAPPPEASPGASPGAAGLESRIEAAYLEPGPDGEAPGPRVLRALGESYGEVGRHFHAYGFLEAAAPAYRNAEDLLLGDPRWPYLLGQVEEELGRGEEAIAAYQRVLASVPEDLVALYRLGEVYRQEGRSEAARAALEKAHQLVPGEPAVTAALGELALAEKDAKSAIELLSQALEQVPEATRLHYPLALAWRQLGERDKAREHLALQGPVGLTVQDPLTAGLEDLKSGERVQLLRGRRAFAVGSFEAAAEAFRRAVEAAPESARARINLGSALAQLGDGAGAVEQYRAALEQEPENPTAHFNLGLLLAGRAPAPPPPGTAPVAALSHLQVAVAAAPDDAEMRLEYARLLRSTGRTAEAAAQYREALRRNPAQERARLAQAGLLVDAGRYGEAREALEAGRLVTPDSGLLTMALARLLSAAPDLTVRDGPVAVSLAEKVFAARGTLEDLELLAQALAEADRCDEAAARQRKALEAASAAEASEPGVLGADRLGALVSALRRYEEERPCRAPGATAGG